MSSPAEPPPPREGAERPAAAPRQSFESSAPPPPPAERRRGGFFPLLLGGILAAAIGYAAAWWTGQDATPPVDVNAELSARDDRIAALENQLAEIGTSVEELAEGPDFTPLQDAIDAADTRSDELTAEVDTLQTELGDTLQALDSRLTDIEQRPEPDGSLSNQAVEAYEREITALREETAEAVEQMAGRVAEVESSFETLRETVTADLAAVRDEADAVEEMTEEAANIAAARDALADLSEAVETGAPFAEPLEAFRATGVAEVPEVLAANAETGVPTLRQLRADFPGAARDALATARAQDDGAGLGSFFERQLNVRSVEPREGDGPDAVLSRAEAAIADGQIARALEEISTLPEAAQEALSNWTAAAETRIAAATATDDLSATLTAN